MFKLPCIGAWPDYARQSGKGREEARPYLIRGARGSCALAPRRCILNLFEAHFLFPDLPYYAFAYRALRPMFYMIYARRSNGLTCSSLAVSLHSMLLLIVHLHLNV